METPRRLGRTLQRPASFVCGCFSPWSSRAGNHQPLPGATVRARCTHKSARRRPPDRHRSGWLAHGSYTSRDPYQWYGAPGDAAASEGARTRGARAPLDVTCKTPVHQDSPGLDGMVPTRWYRGETHTLAVGASPASAWTLPHYYEPPCTAAQSPGPVSPAWRERGSRLLSHNSGAPFRWCAWLGFPPERLFTFDPPSQRTRTPLASRTSCTYRRLLGHACFFLGLFLWSPQTYGMRVIPR